MIIDPPPSSSDLEEIPAICGKGTYNGAAAESSEYGFASCVLDYDHGGQCDSGPALPRAA